MRPWKPLPKKDLARIIADTERDNPQGDHCDDDVYRLAREVEALRQSRHAMLAALGFLSGVSILNKDVVVRQLRDAVRPMLSGE